MSKTLDGVITSWNAAAERMFGYSAAEATGRSITLIIPEDRLDEEKESLGQLSRRDRRALAMGARHRGPRSRSSSTTY